MMTHFTSDSAHSGFNQPSAVNFSHLLRVGNKDVRVSQTREVLNMFRIFAGGGVLAADFPVQLQNVSKQLFDDPEAIGIGAPLEYRTPDGVLVMSAAVGSGVLQLPPSPMFS